MAVIFYDKATGLVRRSVFDKVQTDDELETIHLPQADEASVRIDMRVGDFDLQIIQAAVNKITGLNP